MLKKQTWDKTTDRVIEGLHPTIATLAKMFVCHLEDEGIFVRIYCGYRSPADQLEMWKKGRDSSGNIIDKKSVVTYAKPFQSYHQYSLAFDCVEIINGKADWNTKNWARIGHVGDFYALEWAGNWLNFPEKPHFQRTHGFKWQQLKAMHDRREYDSRGFLKIEKYL